MRGVAFACVLPAVLALAACGGGGGAAGGIGEPAAAAAASTGPTPAPGPVAGAPAAPPTPSSGAPAAPPAAAPSTVQGTEGPDTLQGSGGPAVMVGGGGDDLYLVSDPADVVIEQSGGGVDEVRTRVGYTLPPNVENMSVAFSNLEGGSDALVGNSLDNRITGAAFTQAEILGLEGDDVLDGGGRYGGRLDGGVGNDTLVNNIGESRGGPGADTFVVSPRGAHTAPDVPLTVLDFDAGEGDRIDGGFLAGDPAALWASGHLRFEAASQRLVYTLDPALYATRPSAVEQVILLPGVTSFDPAWIVRR